MNLDSMRVNIFKELMTLDKNNLQSHQLLEYIQGAEFAKVICLYINFNKEEGNCRGDFVGRNVGC